MSKQPLSPLNEHITLLEKELQNAKRMRDILAESPNLATLLVSDANSRNGTPQVVASRRAGGPATDAHFKAILAYMTGAGNEWKTKRQITEATKLHKNQVTHILYKTHRDLFEQKASSESKLVKVWRLKEKSKPETKE